MTAINSFNHIQNVPAKVWNVVHNLKTYPIVDVYSLINGNLERIKPNLITYIDENTCSITFVNDTTGIANII